ncbi:MAG: type 1 glutamine amidotransferase [Clostridia bacterium]|nr:type 1 glutamine amidotransferase [Clostridia bacterium]
MKTNKILVLVHDLAEDLELWYPVYRIREEGYLVHMASEKRGMLFKGKYGVPYTSDVSWDDIHAADYDGLLIPGGWAPDKMRRFERVKELVRDFDAQGKPIGQICHGASVTISAGIMNGVKVTSTPGIMDDLKNAGAVWINEPVVVDDNIVSSRKPEDLTQYMVAFINLLEQGR